MAEESRTSNLPSQKLETGETNGAMSEDELVQLSDLISDCMASESQEDDEDTGSFKAPSDEDTGEFKPVQD